MFVPHGSVSGNGGNGRSVADPYGGIPKELRPDLTHLLMAAAIVHQNGNFAAGHLTHTGEIAPAVRDFTRPQMLR